MQEHLTLIGIMSGTSLDGLDICCVRFSKAEGQYDYQVLAAETFKYNKEWKAKLAAAYNKEIYELSDVDLEFGEYIGKLTKHFILKNELNNKVDLIGSHGQTIFHQPEKGITIQIGDGKAIARATGIPVINDFRKRDVDLGGQGAPLVPIGDKYLFAEYDACLNLGGIANISYQKDKKRIAFDICPANLPINKIVKEKFNIEFDKDGEISSSGSVLPKLLNELNKLDFYKQDAPKSLGYEWLDAHFYTILEQFKEKETAHVLSTIVAHETDQVAKVLNNENIQNCLVTGGGALNLYWIKSLKEKTSCEIHLPEMWLIEFKEALIFAFLAYLNHQGEVNTLSSVTGAKADSIGGFLHTPPQ